MNSAILAERREYRAGGYTRSMTSFCHLHVHSPFSFLDGASRIEELVRKAAELRMPALALTDHNNVCGAVAFRRAAREAGIKPIQGAEISLEDGSHLILLAKNPRGYANLCRILTAAHLGGKRLSPQASYQTLAEHAEDLFCLTGCRRGLVPRLILLGRRAEAETAARKLMEIYGSRNLFLELQGNSLPGDRALNRTLAELAERIGCGAVAACNVHYLNRSDFPTHDLLVCVRTLTRLDEVHPERSLNAENNLKTPEEARLIFRDYPEALRNTLLIAGECREAISLSGRLYPEFPLPPAEDAAGFLRRQVYLGAEQRYGCLSGGAAARLEHELSIINRLGYNDYFLLVWDLARWARSQGIRYAGRGSAADSAVAYCLQITDVDAFGRGLMFERFMSLERAEKPDIDIDFDARHRDRAAEYVYRKYGAGNVAAVCAYNTFRARSAVRDLGKAMEIPEAELDALAKRIPWCRADGLREAIRRCPELRRSGIPWPKFERLIEACRSVAGFPRFMGTHLGGLVISRHPLAEVTPLQRAAKGTVVCQFDKEYVEDLGLIKLDLLSLRTLSAVDDAMATINRRGTEGDSGRRFLNYDRLTYDDPATYRRLNRGETIGVFQLESPAQRALQARLEAGNFEDIVASLALIRPGPIKGNMVEPFVARRRGMEEVAFLHPKLKPILEKTYGVVLFQEQVIEIATALAGFTLGEADRLRRVMTHARRCEDMQAIGLEFVRKAILNGVEKKVAEAVFSYIAGYASYGFCEAHAAAFAATAYKTAYLAEHHPAEFFAAVLSQQPMGYYPVNTLCGEARRRGMVILPPDVNRSEADFTVEEFPGSTQQNGASAASCLGIRVSLRQIKGMTAAALSAILSTRRSGGDFRSFEDFLRRVSVPRDLAEKLILCGSFDSIEPTRRRLLWLLGRQTSGVNESPLLTDENFVAYCAPCGPTVDDFSPQEKFRLEYQITGIMLRGHLMECFREDLTRQGFLTSAEAREVSGGQRVKVAGLPIRPHRPPTKNGRTVVFLSLEDEYGLIEVTIFEEVYQRYGDLLFSGYQIPVKVFGKIQRRGSTAAIIGGRIAALLAETPS